MQFTTAFSRLGRHDARLIRRDSFLIMMIVYLLIMAAITRFAVPWLTDTLLAEFEFDLTPYYPLIASFLALTLGSLMSGIVFGFLLLDERDDRTLTAMRVTPLPMTTFLIYRIVIASLLAFLLAVASLWIMDIIALNALQLVLIAAVAGLYAPIMMLFFGTFAGNKVEGFAMMKIASTIGLIPVGAYFLPEPWQFLAGFFPPYWVSKAMWVIPEGSSAWPVFLLLGVVTMSAVIWWFVRRFNQLTVD
jgi:fluoroquinolone transport system permease protein